jgi:hypothetical protein
MYTVLWLSLSDEVYSIINNVVCSKSFSAKFVLIIWIFGSFELKLSFPSTSTQCELRLHINFWQSSTLFLKGINWYSRIQEKCNHDSCQIFSPPYQGCISFCYHFVSILCFLSICDPHRCLHLASNISSKEKLLGPWVPNFCSNVLWTKIVLPIYFNTMWA